MIYTSYFSNIDNIKKRFPTMIFYSIAGKTPKWFEDMDSERHRKFEKLSPKITWWNEWYENFKDDPSSEQSTNWYIEKYTSTVLDNIEQIETAKELHSTEGNICLLCYEKPNEFCHRHIVSEWFERKGITCVEFE